MATRGIEALQHCMEGLATIVKQGHGHLYDHFLKASKSENDLNLVFTKQLEVLEDSLHRGNRFSGRHFMT